MSKFEIDRKLALDSCHALSKMKEKPVALSRLLNVLTRQLAPEEINPEAEVSFDEETVNDLAQALHNG